MELQSASYFLFLGVVALLHWMLAPRWRVPLLLGASLVFYAVSGVAYLALFLALCTLNYVAVLILSRREDPRGRAGAFLGILTLDLAVLIAFKYLLGDMHYAVPLGISYFTFQMIASAADAYRRDWQLTAGWNRFVLFGFFFPQITSGPIPRAPRLFPQLSQAAAPSTDDVAVGVRLIAYGLFKKFVVANRLGDYTAEIFATPVEALSTHYSTLPTLLGAIYNALNLYADFSSYVDIAIGSARLLGIRLDPNFDRPFSSRSVTEFWRRWHMTLSFWLRDYVFMPLLIRIGDPGNWGAVFALLVTFALCGLWHGATLPYLCWGLTQGLAMSIELLTRRFRKRRLKKLPEGMMSVTAWLYAMSVFVLSEVLFRASSLDNAGMVFSRLIHVRWLDSAADLFAHKGPFDFVLGLIAVGVWFAVSSLFRRTALSAPAFALICGLLTLLLGHLGSGRFIYAGF
jgi:D-alanyl-lipoteichoic acid acyltransferase DltB (MBOAT superfamily)